MAKAPRHRKATPTGPSPQTRTPSFSPAANEVRALLRRIPDGFQAALQSLAARDAQERERVLAELARGLGKEAFPLVKGAALGKDDGLSLSALRILPVFRTRAAGDVLVEVLQAGAEGERARAAREAGLALQAQGINVPLPTDEAAEAPTYTLRETWVSAPDRVGTHSVVARLQDPYGVWHAILVLWNDRDGVRDAFMRPMSRQEWQEQMERAEERSMGWAACPPDFARWQIREARRLGVASGSRCRLDEWDRYVGEPPEGYTPPDPLEWLQQLDPERQQEALASGAELFQQADARVWFLDTQDCAPWDRRWNDLQVRLRLRGTSDALEAETAEVLGEATRALVNAGTRAELAPRLIELARVCRWRHQEEHALRAAAAARAVAQLELDAAEIPCCRELVRRTLVAAWAVQQRPETDRTRRQRRY